MAYVGGGWRSGCCPAASALLVYADCGGTVAGGDAAAGGKVSGGGVLQGWWPGLRVRVTVGRAGTGLCQSVVSVYGPGAGGLAGWDQGRTLDACR